MILKKIKITEYKHLLTLSIILYLSPLFAQLEIAHTQYNQNNGLESNKIFYVHFAKNGLCYIAHYSGLSVWDGQVFKPIFNKNFPFTAVSNIMETDNGDIFCKAYNGQLFMVSEFDSLIDFKSYINTYKFEPSKAYKNHIISTKNDSVIIDRVIDNFQLKRALNSTIETTNLNDAIYFVGTYLTGEYIYYLNSKFQVCKYKINYTNSNIIHQNNSQHFIVKSDFKEFYHSNLNKVIQIKLKNNSNRINFIQYINNDYWILTTNGVYVIKENGESNYILSGYNTSSVSINEQGSCVISTLENGLIQINHFETGLLSNIEGRIMDFRINPNSIEIVNDKKELIELDLKNYNKINSKTIDKDIQYFQYYSRVSKLLDGKNYVEKDVVDFGKGKLIGTSYGIYFYGKKEEALWLKDYLEVNKTMGENFYFFKEQRKYISQLQYLPEKQLIYILTYEGLFEISPNHIKGKKIDEPYTSVSGLVGYKGDIYILTKSKNILLWDGKNYKTPSNELNIKGVFVKKYIYKDELWLQTYNALYCVKNGEVKTYSNAHGLTFSHDLILKFSDEAIFTISNNKILVIPKETDVLKNKEKVLPKIVVRKLIDANTYKILNNGSKINFKNNSIEIWFSLIDFKNIGNVKAAYTINDGRLITLSKEDRKIYLNNLEPGEYSVKLYIISDPKIVNEIFEEIKFTISTPFYKTWWFMALILISVFVLFFIISYFIIKKLKQDQFLKESKLRLEKELDKSILSGIKSQMNPHFIFNALNTIQSYIYKNDKTSASTYISKFSKLTRNILNMSNKEFISLNEEIESLNDYLELEKMRFTDTFDYQFVVDKKLDLDKIQIPSMLLQPYVENSIKHGLLHKKTNRKLELQFIDNEDAIKIVIDDNGIGREASAKINLKRAEFHLSFSMKANLKRLEILKNRYQNIGFEILDKKSEEGQAIGTQVVIHLPKTFR